MVYGYMLMGTVLIGTVVWGAKYFTETGNAPKLMTTVQQGTTTKPDGKKKTTTIRTERLKKHKEGYVGNGWWSSNIYFGWEPSSYPGVDWGTGIKPPRRPPYAGSAGGIPGAVTGGAGLPGSIGDISAAAAAAAAAGGSGGGAAAGAAPAATGIPSPAITGDAVTGGGAGNTPDLSSIADAANSVLGGGLDAGTIAAAAGSILGGGGTPDAATIAAAVAGAGGMFQTPQNVPDAANWLSNLQNMFVTDKPGAAKVIDLNWLLGGDFPPKVTTISEEPIYMSEYDVLVTVQKDHLKPPQGGWGIDYNPYYYFNG